MFGKFCVLIVVCCWVGSRVLAMGLWKDFRGLNYYILNKYAATFIKIYVFYTFVFE